MKKVKSRKSVGRPTLRKPCEDKKIRDRSTKRCRSRKSSRKSSRKPTRRIKTPTPKHSPPKTPTRRVKTPTPKPSPQKTPTRRIKTPTPKPTPKEPKRKPSPIYEIPEGMFATPKEPKRKPSPIYEIPEGMFATPKTSPLEKISKDKVKITKSGIILKKGDWAKLKADNKILFIKILDFEYNEKGVPTGILYKPVLSHLPKKFDSIRDLDDINKIKILK